MAVQRSGARARATLTPLLLLAVAMGSHACGEDQAQGGPDANAADNGSTSTDGQGLDSTPADVAGDTAGKPTACTVAADCPVPTAPCRVAACQPAVGCVEVLLIDGAICDSGDGCIVSAACKAGVCVAGPVRDCDDGEVCTVDSCKDGNCQHTPAQGTPCDDGESCTKGDTCKAGVCTGGPSVCGCVGDDDCAGFEGPCAGEWICDKAQKGGTCVVVAASLPYCPPSANPCVKNACDPATGACKASPVPDGQLIPCDDDNACTSGDVCKGGACFPGADICGCKADADCAEQDDGDLCNGTMFCNISKKPAACELNPATIVSCKSVDDTGCSKAICAPKTGQCVAKPEPDGKACDDGSVCTSGEACKGGACTATANTCACSNDGDCAAKDDGNLCNGTMFCDQSVTPAVCKVNPATVVSCKTVGDTFCAATVCDPKTGSCGKQPQHENQSCDDGDPCTLGEVCQGGNCAAGVLADPCACKADSDCKANEDGNLCNGTLFCDKSAQPFVCKVNPATVKTCTDAFDTACLHAVCVAETGGCVMAPQNSGLPCDDDDPCTKGDFCKAGQCAAGGDICGCKTDLDCAGKDDGNLCNGTPFCDKSALPWSCATNPATVVSCPTVDDTFCRKTVCTPKTGLCELVAVNQGLACDDGDACKQDEICKNGGCIGQPVSCDDGVPCTADACDKVAGCTTPTAEALCDDGNACTIDLCDAAAYLAGKPGATDAVGCVHKPATAKACDDGNACTTGDACVLGTCAGQALLPCDDGNPCTDDDCTKDKGCSHVHNAAPCKAGAACQPFGQCEAGACKALPAPFWQAKVDDAGAERAAAIASAADGAAWIAGRAEVGSGKSLDPQLLVARVAPGGATQKLWLFGAAGDDAGHGVATFDPGGAGKTNDIGALVVGRRAAGSKGGTDAWLLRLAVDGKVLWQQHAGGDGDDEALGVVAWGAGEAAVAGRRGSGDSAAFWLARVDKLGTLLWQATLPGKAGLAAAVDRAADGSFVATGSRKDESGLAGVTVARFSADGIPLWAHDLGLGTGQSGADQGRAVRVLAGGAALVAAGNGGAGRLLRVEADGNKGWDLLFGAGDGGALSSLSPVVSGALTAFGQTSAAGKKVPWMLHAGADGTLLWQRKEAAQAGTALPIGTAFADGRLLIAWPLADATTQGEGVLVVSRDPWGNVDCEAQGACKGKTLVDCDDANPCTFDGCSTELGCTHQIHALPCQDDDPCTLGEACKAGSCQGGKPACDDSNPCTIDTCALPAGCTHTTLESTPGKPVYCDDGNACTQGERCEKGGCGKGVLNDCDDGNVCTDEACDPAVGCLHAPNAAPCDSGNCTVSDVCAAGICKTTGKTRYAHTFEGQTGEDIPFGAVAMPDGGAVIAGRTFTNPDADGLLMRVDSSGKKSWLVARQGPLGCCGGTSADNPNVTDDTFYDVTRTAFGLLAVGQTQVCGLQLWAAMLDENGKHVWSRTYVPDDKCGSGSHRALGRAVAVSNDGTFAIAGYNWTWPYGDTYKAYVLRIDQKGDVVSHKVHTHARQLLDIASRPGGGFVASGERPNGSYGADARLLALDGDGDAIWTLDFRAANTNTPDYFNAVAAMPDGGALGVGYSGNTGSRQILVGRASPSGAKLWQRVWGGAADEIGRAAVVTPTGRITVLSTSWSTQPGNGDLLLTGLDLYGNHTWERVHGLGSEDVAGELLRRPDGSLMAVAQGVEPGEAAKDITVWTFDAWGYGSCKAAGGCAVQPASACDDADPCTADSCLPAGCSHAPLSDGALCADGMTCKKGSCAK